MIRKRSYHILIKTKKLTVEDLIGTSNKLWKRLYLRELNKLRDSTRNKKRKQLIAKSRVWQMRNMSAIEFLEKNKWECFDLQPLILYRNLSKALVAYTSKPIKRKRIQRLVNTVWCYSPVETEDLTADVIFVTNYLLFDLVTVIFTSDYHKDLDPAFIDNLLISSQRAALSQEDVLGETVVTTRSQKLLLMTLLDIYKVKIPYRLLNQYRNGSWPVIIVEGFKMKKQDCHKSTKRTRNAKLKYPETYERNGF